MISIYLGLNDHCRLKNCFTLALIIFVLICCHWLVVLNASYASTVSSKIRIKRFDNLIDISVKNAELRTVLLKLEEITDVHFYFPSSLEKKISLTQKKISLHQTLKRLLKNFNYIILFSGSNKLNASVSKVFIYSEAEKARRLTASERRIANRIKRYEKQIDSIKRQLSRVDQNSSRGKRYLRRIQSIENRISRLRRE